MHELSQLLLNAGPRAMRAIELAVQIADEAAQADIECACDFYNSGGVTWWDIRPGNIKEAPEVIQGVQRAVEYLTLRRRIERNSLLSDCVRILPVGAEAATTRDDEQPAGNLRTLREHVQCLAGMLRDHEWAEPLCTGDADLEALGHGITELHNEIHSRGERIAELERMQVQRLPLTEEQIDQLIDAPQSALVLLAKQLHGTRGVLRCFARAIEGAHEIRAVRPEEAEVPAAIEGEPIGYESAGVVADTREPA